ncbi:thiol:disulfide interchange protein DsbA/DsbL [Pseudomonas sp. MDT2-39-1]
MRHLILSAIFVTGSSFSMASQAISQYVELPQSGGLVQQGKIEVVELFSYGCRHCYDLESTLNPWIEKLPADVNFVRVPAMFGGVWDVQGQAFLTLQAMGARQSVHAAVFEAIRNRIKLTTPDEIAEFLAGEGIHKDIFLSTYRSFAVQAKVMDAKKRIAAYQVSGVPALVIDGKYRFDLSAGGPQGMLKLAEHLIAQERAARLAKLPST